ncbi:hypothetical protein PoB_005229000 [Plakobranchus ocellatus]|uniref:Uncharacterized protein n=1 Tax=Plakobranchus ocellatus TaxID=259542 RepID=A0AAV4C305_9GAST|nr:hypothetical protein PoB_005229000 [Plakobranchus ocellatus]
MGSDTLELETIACLIFLFTDKLNCKNRTIKQGKKLPNLTLNGEKAQIKKILNSTLPARLSTRHLFQLLHFFQHRLCTSLHVAVTARAAILTSRSPFFTLDYPAPPTSSPNDANTTEASSPPPSSTSPVAAAVAGANPLSLPFPLFLHSPMTALATPTPAASTIANVTAFLTASSTTTASTCTASTSAPIVRCQSVASTVSLPQLRQNRPIYRMPHHRQHQNQQNPHQVTVQQQQYMRHAARTLEQHSYHSRYQPQEVCYPHYQVRQQQAYFHFQQRRATQLAEWPQVFPHCQEKSTHLQARYDTSATQHSNTDRLGFPGNGILCLFPGYTTAVPNAIFSTPIGIQDRIKNFSRESSSDGDTGDNFPVGGGFALLKLTNFCNLRMIMWPLLALSTKLSLVKKKKKKKAIHRYITLTWEGFRIPWNAWS